MHDETTNSPNLPVIIDPILIVTQNPILMQTIYAHVAEGGTLIDLCKTWQVKYSELMRFIRADGMRSKIYNQSLIDRQEWAKESILKELRALGGFDMSKVMKDDGTLIPIEDWPDDCKASLQVFEVEEIWGGRGDEREQIGVLTRVKFHDKLKAIDLHGKTLRMWIEQDKDKGEFTLEDLVGLAHKMRTGQVNGG